MWQARCRTRQCKPHPRSPSTGGSEYSSEPSQSTLSFPSHTSTERMIGACRLQLGMCMKTGSRTRAMHSVNNPKKIQKNTKILLNKQIGIYNLPFYFISKWKVYSFHLQKRRRSQEAPPLQIVNWCFTARLPQALLASQCTVRNLLNREWPRYLDVFLA